jgi:hypothetical protein
VYNNANNGIAFESDIGFVLTKDCDPYLHSLLLIRSLGPKLCERITYVWSIRASLNKSTCGRGTSVARHCVVGSTNVRVSWLGPLTSECPVTAGKAPSGETNHLLNASKPARPGLVCEITVPCFQ